MKTFKNCPLLIFSVRFFQNSADSFPPINCLRFYIFSLKIGNVITNTESSFFRKHKRNSSNHSNNSTAPFVGEKSGKSSSKSSNQVTLNSYKPVLSNDMNTLNNQNVDAYSSDSGINTLNIPNLNQANTSKKNYFQNSNKTSPNANSNLNAYENNSSLFNICPKLDEVQIIEPLICKRIAKERLTSLVFKKDCFIVATQDGLINTWGRPSKVKFT